MSDIKRFAGSIVQRGPLYMKDADQYEEELATLRNESADADTQETVNPNPEAQKEIDWESRYKNLQSHSTKRDLEKDKQIKDLQEQFSQLQKQASAKAPPKSKEELEAWVANYPDLAAAIATIADQRTDEKLEVVNGKNKELESKLHEIAQEKFRNELRKFHPDCDDIEQDPKFAEWFAKQRPAIQSLIQSTDVQDTVYALNLYKSDTGISKEALKEKTKDASRMVNNGASKPDKTPAKKIWKESEIMKIPTSKYPAVAEEIEAAQLEGRIDYDLSNNRL